MENNYSNQHEGTNTNNIGFDTKNDQQNNYNREALLINVPNSVGILILGILSVLGSFCCCFPYIGVILAIIAIVLTPKAKKEYHQSPNLYKRSSLSNISAGQICAIIGLALSIMFIIYTYTAPNSINSLQINDFESITNTIEETWDQKGY